jgi:hypothetical protein
LASHLADDSFQGDAQGALAGFAELVSPDASAAFLFCPDGLPGAALVEVFAVESPVTSLEDLVDEAPASLPRQTLPLADLGTDEGRVLSTVRDVDGLAVGSLQYQLLRDGALVDVSVTSPRLEALGAGMPLFEQLAMRVEVAALGAGQDGGHVDPS